MKALIFSILILVGFNTATANANYVAGMNLTELDGAPYEANASGEKTDAQKVVDQLFNIGVRHIVLNPRGIMNDPRGSRVVRRARGAQGRKEIEGMGRLIDYIQGKGMTVGIRPIFFVVRADSDPLFDPSNANAYFETLPDGTKKQWWHGNIQPADPEAWFESFFLFLKTYAELGAEKNIAEFTIGAELYSMTVGVEDQWPQHPFGFPAKWVSISSAIRDVLPNARLMYDINFTDATDSGLGQVGQVGGEIERWRYRIVDIRKKAPTNPAEFQKWLADPKQGQIWQGYIDFWNSLDAIGIDMYRSLARPTDSIPANYEALVDLLWETTDLYANQLDSILKQIKGITGEVKPVIFKEIGYKASEKGFLNPFVFEKPDDKLNVLHQAAAYEAFFKGFWEPEWEWFAGVSFWDAGVSPNRNNANLPGYSPLNKQKTEQVIKSYYEGAR